MLPQFSPLTRAVSAALFLAAKKGHLIKALKLFCSGLEKSPFGAKSDFEIWAFKGFLYLDKKISPKEGLEVSTPENLKWKKYIRQSENANGRPLEPLWGSKKIKVSTKRTLRPINVAFWSGRKVLMVLLFAPRGLFSRPEMNHIY